MDYYLLAEKVHGPMSEESAKEWTEKKGIFGCGICSTENQKVYHNVLGCHNHAHYFPPGTFKGLVEKPRGN